MGFIPAVCFFVKGGARRGAPFFMDFLLPAQFLPNSSPISLHSFSYSIEWTDKGGKVHL